MSSTRTGPIHRPGTRDHRPVILLTFANDRYDPKAGYLRRLADEKRQIDEALAPLEGFFRIESHINVTIAQLFKLLSRFGDRIVLFHFAGHACEDALHFETGAGRAAPASMEPLAERLGMLPELSLVFLNACSTGPHVPSFARHCKAPVIATEEAIRDDVASTFAQCFYEALAEGGSVQEAYRNASLRIRAEVSRVDQTRRPLPESDDTLPEFPALPDDWSDSVTQSTPGGRIRFAVTLVREHMRNLRRAREARDKWPWALHPHAERPEGLDWRLEDALPLRSPVRQWGAPFALAAVLVAGAVFLTLWLYGGPGGASQKAPPPGIGKDADPSEQAPLDLALLEQGPPDQEPPDQEPGDEPPLVPTPPDQGPPVRPPPSRPPSYERRLRSATAACRCDEASDILEKLERTNRRLRERLYNQYFYHQCDGLRPRCPNAR